MTWRRQHLFVPWNRPVCLSGGEAWFSRQELLSSHLISHPGETEVRTGRRERERLLDCAVLGSSHRCAVESPLAMTW